MEEIWKDIPGYNGLYRVSNRGRIMSSYSHNHLGSKYHIVNGSIMKTGYRCVSLCKDGIEKRFYVHRIVATVFIENPNGLTEIDHINTNRLDNRVENLRWASRQSNARNPITMLKMAEAHASDCYRIAAIDVASNTIVAIYPSIEEAGKRLRVASTSLRLSVKQPDRVSGGFRWARLADDIYLEKR